MTDVPTLSENDNEATRVIVQYLKSQGIFDEFRKECLSDVDTKPSFLNLRQRTEGYVHRFLAQQEWNSSLNKNQLRESLRRQINESGMVKYGVEHLVEQVITPKVKTTFYPKIESVVKQFLGIKEIANDIIWPEEEAAEEPSESIQVKQENFSENEEENVISANDAPSEAQITPSVDQEMDVDSRRSENSQDLMASTEYFNVKTEKESEIRKTERRSSPQLKASSSSEKVSQAPPIVGEPKSERAPPPAKDQKYARPPESSAGDNGGLLKEAKLSQKRPEPNESRLPTKRQKSPVGKPENDYLSDVSSVHTSDLSDFDDRISLSSEDDNDARKVKISLKDVKQMADVTSVLSRSQLKD